MSHLKERVERNCLNCNAQIVGKYCHICGQENIYPKESVWHLVNHFFQDITHFDGKFFSTIKFLITRPGFLSAEYARGRRVSYLNPIRMYVFTSAFFFLIFFSFIQKDEVATAKINVSAKEKIAELQHNKENLEQTLAVVNDSTERSQLIKFVKEIDDNVLLLQEDSTAVNKINTTSNPYIFSGIIEKYNSIKIYDSLQSKLPADKKDGWFMQQAQHKMIITRQKYNGNSREMKDALIHKFKHSFPQILFLSLPLFAMVLKLLYVRQKQFYYVNHIIFTIHLYCAIFILLLLEFVVNAISHNLHWGVFEWIISAIIMGMFFYQYKAMRNFYQQGRFKTIIKYGLLNFLMVFIISFLMLGMFIFTALQL